MRLSDSIIVYVPQNLTIDFGYAVWRGRQRRLRKLKKWEQKYLASEDAKDGEEIKKEEEAEELEPKSSNVLQRNQFGGIVDYLEAKYVRGVMVDGVSQEEKVRQKRQRAKQRKLKQLQGELADVDIKEEDIADEELSLSEDDARSTYSADSFLDDTDLVHEVAGQVQASSGITKVEAQAKLGKQPKEGDDPIETQYNKKSNGLIPDCEGFFVNVGDLEMEVENDEDDDDLYFDWAKSPKKKKKKNKETTLEGDEPEKGKSDEGSDKPKKKKKKKSIDSIDETTKDPSKKKTKQPDDTSPSSIKMASGGASVSSTPGQKPLKISEDAKKELWKLRGRAKKANNERSKLYKKCVTEINKMLADPDHSYLPRKGNSSKMETIKVTLSVPEGKKSGDPLMFSNPRDPSQMLRVTIPANAKAGGTFMVSLPVPKLAPTDVSGEENNFSKTMKEALHEYAIKYDEWMDLEYDVKSRTGKSPKITIHKAKMQKFDDLVNEFPPDLEIPIDIPFLRKVVRRMTQNKKKRKESAERNSLLIPPPVKKAKKNPPKEEASSDEEEEGQSKTTNLKAPARSVEFESIPFDVSEFVRHHAGIKA